MSEEFEVYCFTDGEIEDILIEAHPLNFNDGVEPVANVGDKINYQAAIKKLIPAATAVLETIKNLEAAPKSVEVSFGIKMSTQASAVIASAAAEGNFAVKLVWERP